MKFEKLGLVEPILKSIEDQGFDNPTTIQEKSIPLILDGKDVIGGSATGSGKTLAFGSGIIQNLVPNGKIQSLILTPTRELAEQVMDSLKVFGRYKKLNIISIYGGVSINPQFDALRRADVVVGTPGRILDHLQRDTIDLRQVKILVLDEADRMLDMGFIDDVEKIISQCPKERQTLLFSATISTEIKNLTHRYMRNPTKISAEVHVDPSKLKQVYYDVTSNMKFSLLVHLLKSEKSGLVMVFCNTRNNVDFVDKNLNYNGIEAMAIHGGFTQSKRLSTLRKFHSNKAHVLVCTDVAARGLDIPNVSHIYNYDMPKDSKEYVHRIGRTARAGSEGIVVNVISDRDHDNFSRILRDMSEVKVEKLEKPYVERCQIKQNTQFGGRNDNFRNGRSNHRNGSGYGRRSEGGYGRRSSEGNSNRRSSGYGNRSGGSSYSGRSSSGSFGNRSGGDSSRGSSGGYGNRSSGGSYGGRRSSEGGNSNRSSGYGNRSGGSSYSGRSSGGSYGGRSGGDSSRGSSGGNFGNRSSGGSYGGRKSGGENRSSEGSRGGNYNNRSSDGGSGRRSNEGSGGNRSGGGKKPGFRKKSRNSR